MRIDWRWAGLAVLLALCARPLAAADRPNLLLIVAEDLSPRIGAFGDPVARTPNLDALAAAGVRFPNVFTTAGVCAPSRAALITGVHQIALGAQHMRSSSRPEGGYRAVPPPEIKAFPETLRAAGYHTSVDEKLDYQFSGILTGSGPFTIWDREGSDEQTDGWRARPAGGAPFFAMFNLQETHESGVFLPLGSWPHSSLHLAIQLMRASQYGIPEPRTRPQDLQLPAYWPDTPTVRADLARHYDNIEMMDAHVGRILARLEADGLADSTIVVFTTDHGDGLPRAKRELYDSGLRVPMIVRWPAALLPPGRAPGQLDSGLVSFVDLAPTLLEWAGVEAPAYLHGRSLSSLREAPRSAVFASRDRIDEVPDRQRAVRDARFKYIRSWFPEQAGGHRLAFRDNLEMMRELWALLEADRLDADARRWFESPGAERLFDLEKDPEELHDVSTDPAYARQLARLRTILDVWVARVGDTSVQSEAEMVKRFQPGGFVPVTAVPSVEATQDGLVVRCATEGASIGYQLGDESAWRLYTAPVQVEPGTELRAKAVRYGFDESATVSYRAP